jgi:hypothetical protein
MILSLDHKCGSFPNEIKFLYHSKHAAEWNNRWLFSDYYQMHRHLRVCGKNAEVFCSSRWQTHLPLKFMLLKPCIFFMTWCAQTNAQLETMLIFYISPYVRFGDQVAIMRGSLVQSPQKQPCVKNTRLHTLTTFCCHYTHECVNSH